jgi:threonine/homoserine/homoserine lactone efflux protein
MTETAALFSILGALLLGAISPGPSFVLVSRIAMTRSRADGLAAAVGMGLGGALFGALALAGLSALLHQVEWLNLALKIAGGAYLIYIGINIWRGAAKPLTISGEDVPAQSRRRALSTAFLTQVSNPKTAVVYGSIFAALLPAAPSMSMLIMLPILLFVIEAGWYAVVARSIAAFQLR